MTSADHAGEIVWELLDGRRPENLDEVLVGRTEAVKQEVRKLFGRLEAIPETDPRLQTYKAHYDRWDEAMQTQYPWASVRTRLLTDTIEGGGELLLTAAEGLVEAVFFGMDAKGNPLFADGKENPQYLPHCGLGYRKTRRLVRFKKNDKGRKVPTGYAMFPYKKGVDGDLDAKSEEILAFEKFTRKPFVRSENGEERVSSWLESGENPRWPRSVFFDPYFGSAAVYVDGPYSVPKRGVRRLLRGQKA